MRPSATRVRCLANDRWCRSDLARVQGDSQDLALSDADLDAAADQSGIERVVVGVDDTYLGLAADEPVS
jgi:hypothetical protein